MKHRGGFSLIEVTLAIGVFAFVVVAVLALYSLAIDQTGKSQHELQAANLLTRVVDDYRRSFLTGSEPQFELPDPSTLVQAQPVSGAVFVNARGESSGNAEAIYQMRYTLERLPGEEPRLRLHASFAWPARAANPLVALETTTILSRYF